MSLAATSLAPLDVKDGETLLPVVFVVSQAMIDSYAQASGDFNPIHVDPDYAKNGPFGRTIAHGLMTLAFVGQMMNRWSGGRFDADGEIDIAFVAPVFAGDRVEATGTVEDIVERDGQPCARVRLMCQAGERQILAGFALQPMANRKA